MENPLVSIIIPAYNEEAYIERALESIKRQSYDRLETIVVANACRDDTARIARSYTDNVIETPVRGMSKANNLGTTVAQGSIFTFMDADSQMKENLLEQVYLSVVKGYEVGKAKIRPLDDNGLIAKGFCLYQELIAQLLGPIPGFDSGTGGFTFATSELFKKLEKIYGYGFNPDLDVMLDVDFMTRAKKHGNYKFITESCLFTSMRRFAEEGYIKCFIEDAIHGMNPKGKTRKRWQN